jgi:hypothetical protein
MRISGWWVVFAATSWLVSSAAVADQKRPELRTGIVWRDPSQPVIAGNTIFLNRCIGGCTIRPGEDDATANTSAAITAVANIPEFTGWQPGEWEEVVQCVKEIYSPFAIKVVTERPTTSELYEMVMISGSPGDAGFPDTVGGYGNILFPGCLPNPKGVAYVFTKFIDGWAQDVGGSRVYGLCMVIGQETAHNFGLFHEYDYLDDGRSACNNPMAYRTDCGGQKFFRNKAARQGTFDPCGTEAEGPCYCGGSENSHQKLLTLFGPGQSIVPPPSVNVTTPAAGGALPPSIIALAGSKRGVDRVELYLNGFKWKTMPGVTFGPAGQPNPSPYTIAVPGELPNSTYDIVVKAYDDLGILGTSPTVTVTKGAPCTSADTCLNGQQCEQGRCFWTPPTGEVGDSCTYSQFCSSGLCAGTQDQQICTQECVPGVADSCPLDSNLECAETSPGHGVCYFKPDSGGCCSANDISGAAPPFVLAGFGLALILRKRRR